MSLIKNVQPKEATHVPEPPIARFLFADTRMAWFWLIVRLYVGWRSSWCWPGASRATTAATATCSR
jgi:thiosulfate dehydrogenase [quinone] large subunit